MDIHLFGHFRSTFSSDYSALMIIFGGLHSRSSILLRLGHVTKPGQADVLSRLGILRGVTWEQKKLEWAVC